MSEYELDRIEENLRLQLHKKKKSIGLDSEEQHTLNVLQNKFNKKHIEQ